MRQTKWAVWWEEILKIRNMIKAISHLRKDPVLREIIKEEIVFASESEPNLFAAITRNIIGQQLSSAPARIILERFIKLFPRGAFPKPAEVIDTPDQKLRDCGMSWAKVKYIKSLSRAVLGKTLDLENVKQSPDEEVIAQLTKVNGIGRWTAEMILIFHLNRPDVFSVGDLGLRTAVAKFYGVDRNDLKRIAKISLKWSPHRSLASRYLWNALDD